MSLLRVNQLEKDFFLSEGLFQKKKQLKALRGISFEIKRGETFGVVGESGSGKSTLGKCILKLIEPSKGQIFFDGTDLAPLSAHQMKPFRRKIQMIFQDPYASLNPKLSIGEHLIEPIKVHRLRKNKNDIRSRVEELLDLVGLPKDSVDRYPHEFSGGQRQRVGIARALAVEPELIICDEPVSALDVSIQAQILNLLKSLQEKLKLTYIFISHDLRVVEYLCHRIAVMYLGKIVEVGNKTEIFETPKHPYTQVLLSSAPSIEQGKKTKIPLIGEPPKPTNPPSGCSFHPRCFKRQSSCDHKEPNLSAMESSEHLAACPYTE